VRRACPRRLRGLVEDITQDVLLRLIEARRKGWGSRPFPPSYLYRAAYNAIVDELRRRRHDQERPAEEGELDAHARREPMPDREAEGREIGSGLRACLTGLAPPRRAAVTLFLDGLSVQEAAASLGWTFKRTSHLVYRGLADLRACLASKGLAP
jgi:RNA polymerase sigma-70 factor (ECF subfamily)